MLYMYYLCFLTCWISLQCKDNKLFWKRCFMVLNQVLDFNHFNNLTLFAFLEIIITFALILKFSIKR